MMTYITRLEGLELICGGSGIVLEFQVFYEDGEPLDLEDDKAKWYLAPIGMKHSPVLEKDGVIQRDENQNGEFSHYRFTVHLNQEDTENLYGKYVHQPVLIDRKGRVFRRAEGFINFKPRIS